MNKKKVCIFASSSNFLDEIYYKEVSELGKALGCSGFDIVYGGSNLGLMWACVKSAKNEGSKIYGVMPQKLYDILGDESKDLCHEFFITETMRSRKAKLDEMSDAVIAVPGGFGTLEELSEMIVQKQLGYNSKPIIIFNVNHFYDKMLDFFNQMMRENFATGNCCELYYVATEPQEVIDYLNSYEGIKRVINKQTIYNRVNN